MSEPNSEKPNVIRRHGRKVLLLLMTINLLMMIILLFQFSKSKAYYELSFWLSKTFQTELHSGDYLSIRKVELKYPKKMNSSTHLGDFSGSGVPIIIEEDSDNYLINHPEDSILLYNQPQNYIYSGGWFINARHLPIRRPDQDYLLQYNSLSNSVSLVDPYQEKKIWGFDLSPNFSRDESRFFQLPSGEDFLDEVFVIIDGVFGETIFLNHYGEELFRINVLSEVYDRIDVDADGVEEIALLNSYHQIEIYNLQGELLETLRMPKLDVLPFAMELKLDGDQYQANILASNSAIPSQPDQFFNKAIYDSVFSLEIHWSDNDTTVHNQTPEQARLHWAKEHGVALPNGHYLTNINNVILYLDQDGNIIEEFPYDFMSIVTSIYYNEETNKAYVGTYLQSEFELLEISFK